MFIVTLFRQFFSFIINWWKNRHPVDAWEEDDLPASRRSYVVAIQDDGDAQF